MKKMATYRIQGVGRKRLHARTEVGVKHVSISNSGVGVGAIVQRRVALPAYGGRECACAVGADRTALARRP